MELSAATLEATLEAVTGEPADGPAELAELVRRRQPSFAATLYSAWAGEGAALNPGLRFEVDTQRARIERYREVAARLASVAPSAVGLKGLAIADLYPDGLVRYMNDLDYWISDLDDVWRMARLLTEDGWELVAASFHEVDGRLHTTLSVYLAHEDPWTLPYGVELSTFAIVGDFSGYPTKTSLPAVRAGAITHLLLLLAERFEQPFRARDLVDAALLLEAAGGSASVPAELSWAVDALGLWPEWDELLRLLAKTPLPAPPPLGGAAHRARVLGERVTRTARAAARLLPPGIGGARYLQQRMVHNRLRRWEALAWDKLQHRLRARRAVEAGMLLFGLPIELDTPLGEPASNGIQLCDRDGSTFAVTPVGTFLVVPGEEVLETALPPSDVLHGMAAEEEVKR